MYPSADYAGEIVLTWRIHVRLRRGRCDTRRTPGKLQQAAQRRVDCLTVGKGFSNICIEHDHIGCFAHLRRVLAAHHHAEIFALVFRA
jgi:hypothetical protein